MSRTCVGSMGLSCVFGRLNHFCSCGDSRGGQYLSGGADLN